MRVFYKIILEWNPNFEPKYGMVDFDTAEIISMEAVFPEIDIFCVIFTGSSHGTGEHFKFFYDGNRFHLKWMFFMIQALSLFLQNVLLKNSEVQNSYVKNNSKNF